jgi:hypothetical protein
MHVLLCIYLLQGVGATNKGFFFWEFYCTLRRRELAEPNVGEKTLRRRMYLIWREHGVGLGDSHTFGVHNDHMHLRERMPSWYHADPRWQPLCR